MINESCGQKNDLYEKLWNEWSDGVKLSNFEFLSRFGVCEEKLNCLFLELGYDNKKPLNKEDFYKLMKKVESSQKCEKDEFEKMCISSSFPLTQSQDHNENVIYYFYCYEHIHLYRMK
jgi:hypothetical protein